MDNKKYFQSITLELEALKDRVRNYTRHWQTDGEWKESDINYLYKGNINGYG